MAISVLRYCATSIFTDESKAETGPGFPVFYDDLSIYMSCRLLSTCTVFQAEIYAINLAAWKIGYFSFRWQLRR